MEHFKRVQRLWAIWGAVIWIVVIVLFGGIVGSFSYLLKYSEAYQLGVSKLKASSEATYILGDPISTGIPLGAITFNGESGRAVLNFSATGSKAQGRVFVEAFKQGGVWSLRTLTLRVDGRDGVIDLLKQSSVQFESSPRARFVAGPRPQGGLVTIFGKRTFVAGEPCAAPSSPTASAGRTSTRFAITVALSRASTACVVLQAPLPCALAS